MASVAHICGICDLRHVTKPTVSWCSECDEGFCSGCVEHHNLAKATRHHKTMPITEYQKLPLHVLQIPQSCTKHDEKFLFYCKDHELPCCGKCAMEDHKGCNEVINLDDIVKNVKTSTYFEEIEETLAEVVDNIKEIQKVYKGNITILSENRKQIEKQIQNIRFKIDTHLNQIQQKLVDKLQTVEETESKKVFQLSKALEEKEDKLKYYQNTIVNIKHNASDLQLFMSIKQIEQDLAKEEEFILSCVDGDKVNSMMITYKIDESVNTIIQSVHRFGDIILETKFSETKLKRKKKQQAQMFVPKSDNITIDNISAKLQQQIQTQSKNVKGCCILPSRSMAFTCFHKEKVIVIGNDGAKNFELKVESASDLTYIKSDNSIAVSSTSSISVIDIREKRIKRNIQLRSVACGLVERHDRVIYCSSDGIKEIDLAGKIVSDIKTTKHSIFPYIDTHGSNIYYTNFDDDSVTCCDFEGTVNWKFTDKNILQHPLGISVDNEGNVYAVGENLGNVVVISPNGQKSRKLFPDSCHLQKTQALHYDKTTNLLLVAGRCANAFLYKIERK